MGVVSIEVAEPEDWSGCQGTSVDIQVDGLGSGKSFELVDCVIVVTVIVDVAYCKLTPAATYGDDSYISGWEI